MELLSIHDEKIRNLINKGKEGDSVAQYNLGHLFLSGSQRAPSIAAEWFLKAANQGHQDAIKWLLSMYEKMEGLPEDFAKAVEWCRNTSETSSCGIGLYSELEKKAEHGDAEAQYKVGVINEFGWGVKRNARKALELYSRAQANGHPEATYRLGLFFEHSGQVIPEDTLKSVQLFREAAVKGNIDARERLEKIEHKLAEEYLQKFEAGDTAVQHLLAEMYETGRGVEKDTTKAIRWFSESADRGDARSQFRLGVIYLDGELIEKDHGVGMQWLQKAQAQGHHEAVSRINDIEKVNSLRDLAANGDARSQYELGMIYANGLRGIPQNDDEAVEWLIKAEAQGHGDAKQHLDLMFTLERGLKAGARNEHALALYKLSGKYWNDRGIVKNERIAIALLKLAAEKGNARAQYKLGYSFGVGLGVPQDEAEALRWLREAEKNGNAKATDKIRLISRVKLFVDFRRSHDLGLMMYSAPGGPIIACICNGNCRRGHHLGMKSVLINEINNQGGNFLENTEKFRDDVAIESAGSIIDHLGERLAHCGILGSQANESFDFWRRFKSQDGPLRYLAEFFNLKAAPQSSDSQKMRIDLLSNNYHLMYP